MKNTNAINFLLYSYFGFTIKDCVDEWDENWSDIKGFEASVLGKIINKAYKDATQQGAYNTLVDEKGRSEELKFEGAKKIRDGIKNLFKEEDYDAEHDKICQNLLGLYSGINVKAKPKEKAFTYGNAQKWINMTMKYLYIVSQICAEYYDEDYEKYAKSFFVHNYPMKEIEKRLHVPVDSYIIQAAWENQNIKLPVKEDKQNRRGNGREYVNPADFVKPWSQWDNEPKGDSKGVYSDFQESLKACTDNRIDWECQKWIEVAKIRKGE